MNKFVFLCLVLLGQLSFAQETPNTLYQCTYTITRAKEGRQLVMVGNLVDHTSESDMSQYLTLEPPISARIDVTARILLTRFEGEEYFPMTLHPRGNTSRTFVFTRLEGQNSQSLSYSDDAGTYDLTCIKLNQL